MRSLWVLQRWLELSSVADSCNQLCLVLVDLQPRRIVTAHETRAEARRPSGP